MRDLSAHVDTSKVYGRSRIVSSHSGSSRRLVSSK
jgi:hypothetical protein